MGLSLPSAVIGLGMAIPGGLLRVIRTRRKVTAVPYEVIVLSLD